MRQLRVVIPDILQRSMLALVTTRLKYMAEHECERRAYPDMTELEEKDELNKNTDRQSGPHGLLG